MQITADVDGLDRLIGNLRAAPGVLEAASAEAMQKSVFLVEAAVKARTPRVTGRLFSSINGRLVTPTEGSIKTNVNYARYVESGRGPITAKPGKTLRFKYNGRTIYRKSVGPAAGRFMFREGLAASMEGIKAFFHEAARRVTEAVARG